MDEPMTNTISEQATSALREPVEVISQINKLTQENKILWHIVPAEQTQPDSSTTQTQAMYEAPYNNNTLRLTRRLKRTYVLEPHEASSAYHTTNAYIRAALRLKHELHLDKDTQREYYWQSELLLQLFAPSGLIIWSPKYVTILDGLETSVQYQTTSPAYRNFVNEIFADGE